MKVAFGNPVWKGYGGTSTVHFFGGVPQPSYHYQQFHYACGLIDYWVNFHGGERWQTGYYHNTNNPYKVTCRNCLRTAKKNRYPEDM